MGGDEFLDFFFFFFGGGEFGVSSFFLLRLSLFLFFWGVSNSGAGSIG